MKCLNPILLLLFSAFMTACSVNTTQIERSCIEEFPNNEQMGILRAIKDIEEEVTTNLFTGKVSKKTISESACRMTCLEGFSKYKLEISNYSQSNVELTSILSSSKDREVCIPNQKPCPPIGLANLLGIDMSKVFSTNPSDPLIGTASGLDVAVYSECSEGEEEPESCLAGSVFNSNTNSCVQQELSCTEEELNAIGAATGYKQFNTFSNEYDLCQASTCQEGYTLGLGICNPDIGGGGDPDPEIYGCMDSRADNYNAAATVEDNSCLCDPPKMPYSPIVGCEDSMMP